jgi:hypothetical protein
MELTDAELLKEHRSIHLTLEEEAEAEKLDQAEQVHLLRLFVGW